MFLCEDDVESIVLSVESDFTMAPCIELSTIAGAPPCCERDEHYRPNVLGGVQTNRNFVRQNSHCICVVVGGTSTNRVSYSSCHVTWFSQSKAGRPTSSHLRPGRYQFSLQWFQQLAGFSIDNALAGETPFLGNTSELSNSRNRTCLLCTACIHITYYILHVTYYILHSTYCILHINYHILHTTYYILHTTYYILHITYYILHTTYYMLHALVEVNPVLGGNMALFSIRT